MMHDLSQLSHSSLPDTSTPLQFPAQFMDLKDSWTFEFRSWWGYKMGERRLLTHHIERTCWPRPLVLANIINFHYGKPLRFPGVYLTLQLVSLQFIKHLVHWPNQYTSPCFLGSHFPSFMALFMVESHSSGLREILKYRTNVIINFILYNFDNRLEIQ